MPLIHKVSVLHHDAWTPAGVWCGGEANFTAQERERQEKRLRLYELLFSGALAGAVSRTCTAPVDRLKMILQVSTAPLTVRQGWRQIASEGTLRAYFKGNGANVLKITPETAVKLALNDRFKGVFAKDPTRPRPEERMIAGGLAGAVAQLVCYPLDVVRTRLTVSRNGMYEGIFHCMSRIKREEGMRAFYRGLSPSMIGIVPFAGVDIMVFEMLKQVLLDAEGKRGLAGQEQHMASHHLALLGAGMLSSTVAQVVSYPLALVRTRLQAQGHKGCTMKYKGMADVIRRTVADEGVKGLYKGLGTNIIKLAPAAGISWYIFEEVKAALGMDKRI